MVMDGAIANLEGAGVIGNTIALREVTEDMAELVAAAQRLEARGFFAPSSCADAATAADMRSMRSALAKFGGR
jgi:hypothetical protein